MHKIDVEIFDLAKEITSHEGNPLAERYVEGLNHKLTILKGLKEMVGRRPFGTLAERHNNLAHFLVSQYGISMSELTEKERAEFLQISEDTIKRTDAIRKSAMTRSQSGVIAQAIAEEAAEKIISLVGPDMAGIIVNKALAGALDAENERNPYDD